MSATGGVSGLLKHIRARFIQLDFPMRVQWHARRNVTVPLADDRPLDRSSVRQPSAAGGKGTT